MELLTITQASQIAQKSIQTIRRMIKQKKIQVKRQKTPQGFNYLIIKDSLTDFLENRNHPSILESETVKNSVPDVSGTGEERTHRSINNGTSDFAVTIQKLIGQHEKDKEHLYQLLKTFQDRVFTLEQQIKMIEAPKTKRRWFSWWK